MGAKPLTMRCGRAGRVGLGGLGLRGGRRSCSGGVFAVVAALACAGGGGACSCNRATPPAPTPAKEAGASALVDVTAIARAEDLRRAKEMPPEAQRSHDPAVRRLAARAFARILDSDDAPLLRALEDSDDEVVAWASYGLGQLCKVQGEKRRDVRNDERVRAIVARLSSLPPPAQPDSSAGATLDPSAVMLRAMARCGGDAAEQTLRSWVRRKGVSPGSAEQAAYALGEMASKRGMLSLETAGALLDAAEGNPPLDAAFYAFGRADLGESDTLLPRAVAAAKAALGRAGPVRLMAIRALGRTKDASVAGDLAAVLASADASAPERVEAARSLGRLGSAGQTALTEALSHLVPDDAGALAGDGFGCCPLR